MPVRPDVVRRKLLDIGETISHLRSLLPITIERLERDVTLRCAVEHGLHLGAESLFDAGNHILSAEFQEVADEYREIPPRLVVRGVIASATAARLESLAGFRNVLVHDYATVDVRRVHAGLARLDDFEAFVVDVELWLARLGL